MTFTTTENEGAIQNWMQEAQAETQRLVDQGVAPTQASLQAFDTLAKRHGNGVKRQD